MSRINVDYGLEEILASGDVFVLFYASWCPFSQRFLPVFEKLAREKTRECAHIIIDDKASLCDKYSIEVVPTVLLFSKGAVKKRLDGVPGEGLTEEKLHVFVGKH